MFKAMMVPPHGVFLDACYRHCSIACPAYDIAIQGVTAAQVSPPWRWLMRPIQFQGTASTDSEQAFRLTHLTLVLD